MAVKPRSVTPIIAKLRDLMNGRKLQSVHRFEGYNMSPRSVAAPNLPGGVSDRIAANYYYERDGRRYSEPSKSAYDSTALPDGKQSSGPSANVPKPGFGYNWETGRHQYQ